MEHSNRYKLIGLMALCLFIVPLLGWWTGQFAESRYEGQFRDVVVNDRKEITAQEFDARGLSYITFCKASRSQGANAGIDTFCSYADEIEYVKFASIGTAAVGVVLFVLILAGRMLAGTDRKRMSLVFGPLVRVVMLLLAVSVLAQGALFVYSIYTIEVVAIQRVHIGILLAVALGAIAACWVLLKSSLALLKREPMFLRAIALDKHQHQGFFAFVSDIAAKLKAQSPDHIVVGLEPNFFVTAADVRLAGQDAVLKGRTLFVSLSLLHVFSKDELASVVGHELGHFRGEDVAYSMKFAPTYARLGQALAVLGQSSGSAADLGRLPAQVALSMCFMEFAYAERSVGRERELMADRYGAEAADAQALARALVKLSLFAPQWGALTTAHTDELAKGRTFTNLAQTYAGVCAQVTADLDWPAARDELGKSVQSHPIDTHPPLLARLQNLKTTLFDLEPGQLGTPDVPATTLVPGVEQIEEALSTLEVQWLVAIRAVVLPDPPTT